MGDGATTPVIDALRRALERSPKAFADGLEGGRTVALPFPADAVRNVAVCGIGAAGEAGDLVLGALGERILLPAAVVSGYSVPGWVGPDTLVVLLSASGATEETLTGASLAVERNALCVAVTGGGKLGTFYADEGVPVVPVPADGPGGAATPQLIGALVGLLDRLGIAPLQPGEADEAGEILAAAAEACAPATPDDGNPARQLAAALHDALPLVWGGELTAPVARRWASRMRLHAKAPAWASELPHMNHDELMALPGIPPDIAERMFLVTLRDSRQQRQVQRRFDHTVALVADRFRGHISVGGDGRGPLARMLDLLVVGDHLALYLAEARGVDAGPGAIADELAQRLAKFGQGRTAQG